MDTLDDLKWYQTFEQYPHAEYSQVPELLSLGFSANAFGMDERILLDRLVCDDIDVRRGARALVDGNARKPTSN